MGELRRGVQPIILQDSRELSPNRGDLVGKSKGGFEKGWRGGIDNHIGTGGELTRMPEGRTRSEIVTNQPTSDQGQEDRNECRVNSEIKPEGRKHLGWRLVRQKARRIKVGSAGRRERSKRGLVAPAMRCSKGKEPTRADNAGKGKTTRRRRRVNLELCRPLGFGLGEVQGGGGADFEWRCMKEGDGGVRRSCFLAHRSRLAWPGLLVGTNGGRGTWN